MIKSKKENETQFNPITQDPKITDHIRKRGKKKDLVIVTLKTFTPQDTIQKIKKQAIA